MDRRTELDALLRRRLAKTEPEDAVPKSIEIPRGEEAEPFQRHRNGWHPAISNPAISNFGRPATCEAISPRKGGGGDPLSRQTTSGSGSLSSRSEQSAMLSSRSSVADPGAAAAVYSQMQARLAALPGVGLALAMAALTPPSTPKAGGQRQSPRRRADSVDRDAGGATRRPPDGPREQRARTETDPAPAGPPEPAAARGRAADRAPESTPEKAPPPGRGPPPEPQRLYRVAPTEPERAPRPEGAPPGVDGIASALEGVELLERPLLGPSAMERRVRTRAYHLWKAGEGSGCQVKDYFEAMRQELLTVASDRMRLLEKQVFGSRPLGERARTRAYFLWRDGRGTGCQERDYSEAMNQELQTSAMKLLERQGFGWPRMEERVCTRAYFLWRDGRGTGCQLRDYFESLKEELHFVALAGLLSPSSAASHGLVRL